MNWLILPPEKLPDLEAINQAHNDRRIDPIKTIDGVLLISADLATDSFLADYHEILFGLSPYDKIPTFDPSYYTKP